MLFFLSVKLCTMFVIWMVPTFILPNLNSSSALGMLHFVGDNLGFCPFCRFFSVIEQGQTKLTKFGQWWTWLGSDPRIRIFGIFYGHEKLWISAGWTTDWPLIQAAKVLEKICKHLLPFSSGERCNVSLIEENTNTKHTHKRSEAQWLSDVIHTN